MAVAATLVMWVHLRSPELAEDFVRLMDSDRDIVHGSLETMEDWRLTRPMDLPGQAIDSADYVLIAEIVNVEHWQQQAELRVQALAEEWSIWCSPTDIVRVDELGRRYVACPAGQAPHSGLKLTDDERTALVHAPSPPPDGTMEPGHAGFTPRNILVGDRGVTDD